MARKRTEEGRRAGQRIAALREAHHLTQQAAANKLKVGYRSYQAWESGESVPRWHNRVKLGALYHVDPAEILGPPSPPLGEERLAEIEARVRAIEHALSQLGAAPATPGEGAPAGLVADALAPLVEAAASPPPTAPGRRGTRQAARPRKPA